MNRGPFHGAGRTKRLLVGCCFIVVAIVLAEVAHHQSFVVVASRAQGVVDAARAELEKAIANEKANPTKEAALAVDAALAKYNAAVALETGGGNGTPGTVLTPESPTPTITPETEPNNTSGTANVINLTTVPCAIVSGAINPGGDLDFFTFTGAPAGSRIWIETDTGGTQNAGATSRDTVIDLLAADGSTVIENDDDDGTGNGGDGTVETGLASMIGGRTLTAGGTYFIRVRAFSATGIINPYRLFVVLTNTAGTAEVEPNNTAATANSIVTAVTPIGLRTGAIGTAGDVDYYSVVATAGNIVYFNADADPERDGTGTDLVVEFRDPSDVLLLSVDSSITGNLANPAAEGANFTITTSGTYFIKVRHFSATGTGTYHLMVSACSSDPVGGGGCTVTCPANITKSNDPNQCGAVVTYPAPTTTGTCGTVTCSPASGSFFPVGTTTVTCTAAGAGAGASPGAEGAGGSFAAPGDSKAPSGGASGSGGKGATIGGASGGIITGSQPTTSNTGGGAPKASPGSSPQSPFAVLYDQNNNPAPVPGGVTSQNFETAFDAFDNQAADDFVVPAGQTWTIQQVFVVGEYSTGAATSANVFFFSDSGTLPGAAVYTATNQPIVDVAGDFTITLTVPAVLTAGTYWVSVQANENFTGGGQWFWDNRTTISNSGAAWRNPGGGFGVGCTSFGRKTTCLTTQNGPDQLFQILGTSAAAGGGSSCTFTVTVQDTQPPTITCPANISRGTDPNLCGAIVTYPLPTVADNCPGVGTPIQTSGLPSGSLFPPGTTTNCFRVTDAAGNTASCCFMVQVTDTQPPTITCPANITAVTDQNACPAPACQTVTFPPPVATDNCPGVTVVCNPPSGSCFPIGVTTVTCTATDASGNTATCSFTISTFDVALQDDSDPSIILLWNSLTGAYRFCCNGITFTGIGKSTIQGCVFTLQHNPADRRVLGRVDKAVHAGTASLQAPPGTIRCTITDRNTLNDTLLPACQ